MAYTPPPGSSTSLVFLNGYFVPNGDGVLLEFVPPPANTILVPSIGDLLAFGAPVVYKTQYISDAGGLVAGAFGAPVVDFHRLRPLGIFDGEVGTPTLRWTQFVSPVSFDHSALGSGASLSGSNRYQAPAGALDLRFGSAAYVMPNALSVGLEFEWPYLRAFGFAAGGFGDPYVSGGGARYLSPQGFNAASFGAPLVAHKSAAQTIYPVAFNACVFDAPATYLKTRYIIPVGLDAFKDFGFGAGGSGFVDFGIRRRYPVGFDASLFGTAFVSGGLRYVGVPHFDATLFGTAFVAYKERFIEPLYFIGTRWGTAMVGRPQTLTATGFVAALFGSPEVFDNRKRAYPPGFVATQFGTAFIAPRVRDVYPVSFWSRLPGQIPETRWGRPEVYNSHQYVRQYYEVTPDDGGVFGRWQDVANRNRVIQAYGWRTDKFPLTTLLQLKGVALTPAGFVSTQFGNALVAYRIRTITTIGEDTSLFTQWASVRNTAQVLPLAGFNAPRVGTPSVVNTRRYFDYIGAGNQGAFGVPFVAYRVRTLAQYYPYEGGEVKEPLVSLGRRYVRPVGIAPKEVGAATVEEHFNIIAPRWVYVDRLGVPTLHNVTPELGAYGHDSSVFGATAIHNQFEHYAIQGFVATIFGSSTAVEYRTKQVAAPGIQAIRWGPNTRIRNIIPDPPSPQTLQVNGWDSSFPLPTGAVVRGNVIYLEGALFTAFGVARVVSMGIGPAGGIYLLNQFGTPSLNPAQYITQSNLEESTTYGKPRMSPHTIWAGPATSQAVENHNNVIFYPIDFFPELTLNRPKFGSATVTNKNRSVSHNHGSDPIGFPDLAVGEKFGQPAASNRRRWICPSGKSAFKYGIPLLNGGSVVESVGEESLQMGEPGIDYYVNPLTPRHVYPKTLNSFDYGQPVVSNLNRYLQLEGIDATVIGTARLHPPEPIIPEGFRSDIYGDTFISNYIRNVYPVGVETLDIGYVGGSFLDRMRVRHRNFIVPTSCNSGGMGAPMVSNRVRTIRPTDEIVGVVPAPVVTSRSYVSVAAHGIDAGAFGDVQRWEAGKIKPYGDDMLQPGYPRTGRTITPASILGQIGAPRIGQPIRPTGLFTQVIGGATITHGDNLDYVCGQTARGIPVPGNHFGVFGIPVVS